MTRPVDAQQLCLWCTKPLATDGVLSRVYNAAFDQSTEIHTGCLGQMIATAFEARKAHDLMLEREGTLSPASMRVREQLRDELLVAHPRARLSVVAS